MGSMGSAELINYLRKVLELINFKFFAVKNGRKRAHLGHINSYNKTYQKMFISLKIPRKNGNFVSLEPIQENPNGATVHLPFHTRLGRRYRWQMT